MHSPPRDLIESVSDELIQLSVRELDQMYARFWQWYTSIEDYDNGQADQLLATIFAIEEVRQFNARECNRVRQNTRPRVV